MTVIPAAALMLWAIAIMLGCPPELLRIIGPAVIGVAVVAHVRWESPFRDR